MIGFRKSSIHMFRSFDNMKENTRILMDMKVRYQYYSIEKTSHGKYYNLQTLFWNSYFYPFQSVHSIFYFTKGKISYPKYWTFNRNQRSNRRDCVHVSNIYHRNFNFQTKFHTWKLNVNIFKINLITRKQNCHWNWISLTRELRLKQYKFVNAQCHSPK